MRGEEHIHTTGPQARATRNAWQFDMDHCCSYERVRDCFGEAYERGGLQ
jgi:hypothetical protein